MKKLFLLAFSSTILFAQAQKVTDARLNQRLEDYMLLNKQLAFDKIMDYMHPKLFTIAPKEAILQSFEKAFKSEEMKFSFDSMRILSISPAYKYSNATYRKVDYFMQMTIALSDSTDLKDEKLAAAMRQSFTTGFPGKKITIVPEKNAIKVEGKEIMFAIKDPSVTEWMFLGYDRSNPQLVQLLYPKQVRQYFKVL